MSTPMRRIRSGCCARAASGHVAATLPIKPINSRRLIWPTPAGVGLLKYSTGVRVRLSPLWVDFVAKLGGRRLARNNRIRGKQFLNRCCALIAVLESMLPARALKIVLQHYLPNSEVAGSFPGS